MNNDDYCAWKPLSEKSLLIPDAPYITGSVDCDTCDGKDEECFEYCPISNINIPLSRNGLEKKVLE